MATRTKCNETRKIGATVEGMRLGGQLPAPWLIEDLEKKIPQTDNRPRLQLPNPDSLPYWEEGAPGASQEENTGGSVVIIDL